MAWSSEVETLSGEAAIRTPVLRLGLPDKFIDHGDQAQLMHQIGLDQDSIQRKN